MSEQRKGPWKYDYSRRDHLRAKEHAGFGFLIERAAGGKWAVRRKRTGTRVRTFETKKQVLRWIAEHGEEKEV